jgi:predicted ATPase/transcriptional regulator with XRE-family HTH domain
MERQAHSFSQWIKQRRRALDLTQEDLSECVGCSTITIQKIELGERRASKQVAQRLAECLRIPPDENEQFVSFARGESDTSEALIASAARSTVLPQIPTPNNLPTPLTSLIGRADALEAACGYLLREDIRLLTLTGVPGIGKTRLSLAVAARLLPEFKDGVFFVELASINEPDLVASTVATTLGCKDTSGGSHLDALKQFIRDQRMLLVLDNFEQVLDAAPFVVDLLGSCPTLKVLVTSREALHILGEQQLPVSPLEVPDLTRLPDVHDGQAVLRYPAVELFAQRAAAVDPGFAVTHENDRVVAAVCTRLEGLPLAIELAAARIRMLTPVDLLSHLDQRLKLLTGGPRHLPTRLQTLRGAIDWSYRLLNPTEQSMFACLGVFVGGATLPAIQAVYSVQGDPSYVLEGVGSLVDKNLLRREASTSRFTMLEMIREYAGEKLLESGNAEAVRRAHALYFLQLAEEAGMKVWGLEERIWLDRLEEEHDNLRAAFQWCLSGESGTDGVEMGLRLVAALGHFWNTRGHVSEARERIASVLSHPGAAEPKVKALRAQALAQASALAFSQSDYAANRSTSEETLAIYQELGDKKGIAYTLTVLGDVAREEGDYDTAVRMCEQGLSIFRDLGHTDGIEFSLTLLGWAEMRPGSFARGTMHLEEALALARQSQTPDHIAMALSALGGAMIWQGEYERAAALLQEGLSMRKAAGNRWGTAAILGELGWLALRQGNLEGASVMLLESLSARKDLKDRGGVAWCLERLAEIETAEDRHLHAAHLLGAAKVLRQSIHTQVDIADQPDYERTVVSVRSGLGEQGFADAFRQGEAMTFEQAVAYAHSNLAESDPQAPAFHGKSEF